MDKGNDFLKAQINNALAMHQTFTSSLEAHAKDAEDPRFRALCRSHASVMKRHETLLKEYQASLGAEPSTVKQALGSVLATAKEWTDALRSDDFLRLVSDVVMARQGEDTFRTFRESGRILGDAALRSLGEIGEEDHDAFVREARELAVELFVEHARIPAGAIR